MYHAWYTVLVGIRTQRAEGARVPIRGTRKAGQTSSSDLFGRDAGGEPVRDWLKSLPSDEDRKRIGEDIKTVEFGWPVGMPACRPLGDGVHEVRTSLAEKPNRASAFLYRQEGPDGFGYMDSSRKRERLRMMIWDLRGGTGPSIKGE